MKRDIRDIYSIPLNENAFSKLFAEYLKQKKKNGKLQLAISLTCKMIENPENTFKKIEELAKVYGFNPFSTKVILERTTIFSPKQLKKLKDFNIKLKEKFSNKIEVLSINMLFTLGEVENACNQIYDFYKGVAKSKLSPAECLLSAYILATSKKYAIEDQTDAIGKSRSIYGILNSDKIVCLGYISLINNLTYNISYNKLYLIRNTTSSQVGKEFVGHSTAIVYIDDPKYNLKGFYFIDPTKDVIGYDGVVNLNHFLVPLKDIKFSKHQYLNRKKHTTQKAIIKNQGRVKFSAPKIAGSYYSQCADLISYGQEGIEIYDRASIKDILQILLGQKVPKNVDDAEAIKTLMEQNSQPISYVNMQNLVFNTMLKFVKNANSGDCWKKANKIMKYSTMRANAHYNLCEDLQNPFAVQAFEEKRFKKHEKNL